MSASDSERNRVLYASIIARCWQDDSYRKEFIQDPTALCQKEGIIIPEGVSFVVKENTADTTYVVMPDQRVDEAIQQFSEALASLLPLPDGHSLTMIQNTPEINHIVLPLPPASIGVELSEADLAAIAGGAVGVNAEVAANAYAVANAAAWANVAAATMAAAAAVAVCVLVLYPFNVPEFLKESPVKKMELE